MTTAFTDGFIKNDDNFDNGEIYFSAWYSGMFMLFLNLIYI